MYTQITSHKTLNISIISISMLCMLVYALGYFIWGEKLPVSGGLGWDGLTYAAYATNFIHEITTTSDIYHVNRIFPSLVIYCVTKILGLKLTTPHATFTAFYFLNTAMFLGVTYFWYKICKLKAFNNYVYWLGFISLFANYACLKLAPYAPVFSDPRVLFFGTWILFLYLKQKYLSICMVLLPVFFTWPIAIILTIPLVVYTFSNKNILNSSRWQKINASIVVILFLGCISALLYILSCHSNLVQTWYSTLNWSDAWWSNNNHMSQRMNLMLAISLLIACIYIYFVALYSNIFTVIKNAYRINLINTIMYILLVITCMGTLFWLSHLSANYTGKTIFSGPEFLAITMLGAIAKPALNLIMHATFLGPCAILWLFYMRMMFKTANEETLGLLFFVIITYVMALNAHSRQLTFNLPIMVYLLCKTLNNLDMIINKTKFVLLYLLSALVSSKIYYVINIAPFQGDILSDSFQRFFMNFGLWTQWHGYFFNASLTLIMCLCLYFGFYNNTKKLPLLVNQAVFNSTSRN